MNGSEEDSEAQEQKLFSCKLCDKVFRSSFILCLHLQIHKKVGSVPNNAPSSKQGTSKSGIIKNKITPNKTNDAEPPPIFNKNFVENLKKNLSLAMNRKL